MGKVSFVKGPHDNPKINAILVLKGTVENTEFAEKKKKMDEMNKKKLYELKKSHLLDMKHHPDIEYDEDLLLNDENDHLLNNEDVGFMNVLFSLHGSYIFASFALLLIFDFVTDIGDNSSKKKLVHAAK